jgi:hypothetical protein
MKIRHGFVSNSSSSSFTCQVSGETLITCEGLYDLDMCECENGHTFFTKYLVGDRDEATECDDWPYEVPAKFCPICQMEHVTDGDMNAYLMKKHGADPEATKAEIRATFASYDSLRAYLKAK